MTQQNKNSVQTTLQNNSSPEISGSSFGLRLAFFYMGIFSIYGVQVPYLPVWLEAQELSVHQVGYVIALPFLVRLFFTPAYAIIADHYRAHRTFILVLAVLSVLSLFFLRYADGFAAILVLCSFFLIATASITPLAETVAITGGHTYGLDYGRIRLWGSLSFAFFGLMGGSLIDHFGTKTIIFLLIVTAVITLLMAYFLPCDGRDKKSVSKASKHSLKIFSPEVKGLVQSKIFISFLIAVSAIQGSHSLFYTFGVLHFQKLGLSGFWIGFLWALGVLSEVIFFALSSRIFRNFTPLFLMTLGGMAAIFRWGIMSLDPPFIVLIFLQGLHALTFGATHLGAIRFISEAVSPKIGATAQALHSSFAIGIVMGASTASSGTLYALYSGKAFAFMAALSSVSLGALAYISAKWDGERL